MHTNVGREQPERCTVLFVVGRTPDCREDEKKKGEEGGMEREENRERGGGKSSRNYASGSRDQWNLIRVESCAASFLVWKFRVSSMVLPSL